MPEVCRSDRPIPFYGPDGTSFGYRSMETARQLLTDGLVTAALGRKGHARAIFLRKDDGASPVEAACKTGKRYSYPQQLETGHRCWKHKNLDFKDDDGKVVSTRGLFQQVVRDCLVAPSLAGGRYLAHCAPRSRA